MMETEIVKVEKGNVFITLLVKAITPIIAIECSVSFHVGQLLVLSMEIYTNIAYLNHLYFYIIIFGYLY